MPLKSNHNRKNKNPSRRPKKEPATKKQPVKKAVTKKKTAKKIVKKAAIKKKAAKTTVKKAATKSLKNTSTKNLSKSPTVRNVSPVKLVKNYSLRIVVEGEVSAFTHILLYDGYGELIERAYGRMEKKLSRGLYNVTIEFNEKKESRVIVLDRNQTATFRQPRPNSSIAVAGYSSSHEYYSENAQSWSKKATAAHKVSGDKQTGSLFCFFRYPDKVVVRKEKLHSNPGRAFFILDKNRQPVFSFSDNKVIRHNKHEGWMAFHAQLKVGIYFLHYAGEGPCEIPLYVYKNWQTQVFLSCGHKPIFESLKILIESQKIGFDPTGTKSQWLDAMIQKMYNGIPYVPDSLLHKLAYEKWENPMAGLLAAYIYLASDKKNQDELFKIVVRNLNFAILPDPESPDIIALNMLSCLHFKQKYDGPPLRFPGMILAGIQAALNLSYNQKGIFEKGGFAEQCIKRLRTNLIWTSYEPDSPVLSRSVQGATNEDATIPGFAESKSIKNSWVANSILFYISKKKEGDSVSITDLARQLQVTSDVVEETINRIMEQTATPKSATRTIPPMATIQSTVKETNDIFNASNISKLMVIVKK